ncbi:carbohydrate binding domain-containing protein [Paenibacillus oenotherae]|uniref:carbohydrate binding domain-containing protein n=1 Tax=Paenibacillus oenotherae TaxID=1435645 RepID=UPI0024848AEC|nr:carbohydrate binding domain-containing protein [Paenibacillus oenotherae]
MKKLSLFRRVMLATVLISSLIAPSFAFAEIAASHVYHNHMPNFWPYYDLSKYSATPVGGEIRYMYDGQVIDLKKSPPAGYPYYLPNGTPMPHDDLVSYYSHHAKVGAYLYWPWSVAQTLRTNHPSAQMQVTMSGSAVNNVNSFMYTNNIGAYNNVNWGAPWKNAYNTLKTPSGKRTMDLVHFTGHHSMGPLTGNEYMLKDLIYQNVTLAQPSFLGADFKSSQGFFPTELGFSERIIPVLEKLGIKWSVIGNNHFSRTLKDYPLLNDPGKDTMVSPPNRADLQNESNVGSWISQPMFNEQQVTHNKFPFASTPHWVKYVNPTTGQESKIVGVPVAQAESWEEGYQGSVTAKALKPFEGLVPQKQFFVIAHDGDNSQGRAGDEGTWRNAGNVTYSDAGVKGIGIDEYLVNNTPAASDVVHVQDGSWIDTRDSSSDPQWHHWKLPFGIWKGQFADFNRVNGTDYEPKKNLSGQQDGMTVSFEYGYHYLERNFALLQAALNYAKTAEQIWLDDNPNYWSPKTELDRQVTYQGNQLNPWMMSYPVKGDPANNYAGGANPAELSWYFLIPALDSGFGYYDENVDDGVKPTLSFNQSLHFSKPYVASNASKDKTGPSVWWPQRWPYNPGSANVDKSEGWTLHYFDNTFGIYTYAYDMNGITDIKLKVRTHRDKSANASDNTFRVYDPAALKAQNVPGIDPAKVGAWVEYPMNKRDLKPDINGVEWQASSTQMFKKVPAQEIGDLYFTYLNQYRDQLLDYYIEAVDSKGNVTKSDIQQVYVGTGKYKREGGKIVEDINGDIEGTYPFITDKAPVDDVTAPSVPTAITSSASSKTTISLSWTPSTDDVKVTGYEIYRNGTKVGTSASASYTDSGLTQLTSYTYTIKAYDKKGNISALSAPFSVSTTDKGNSATIYYKQGYTAPYIHYRPNGGAWTVAPGVKMPVAEVSGYNKITIDLADASGVEAVFNNGSGTWDNNGGQNYKFNAGTSTFAAGTITIGAPQGVDTEAPTVPTALKANSKTTNSVTLGWTASSDNVSVTGYEIWRGNTKVGTTATTSYTDTGLTANTAYSYTVKAYDAANNVSGASSSISVTTEAVVSQPPSAPGNPTVTGKTQTSVTLGWTASTGTVTGYEIWRGATKVGTSATTSYTDTGLTAGTAYSYTIKAYNANQVSEASISVSVTTDTGTDTQPPTAPTNLVESAKTANSATLGWTASTDNIGVTGYNIYNGSTLAGSVAGTVTSYTVTGLTPNTAYSFTVKAKDAAGNESNASQALSVTTSNVGSSSNLIVNPGFETYTGTTGVANNWTKSVTSGVTSTFELVTTPVAAGSKAQQVTGSNLANGNAVMIYQYVPVTENTPYNASGQFKVNSLTNARVQLYIDFYNASNSLLGYKKLDYTQVSSSFIPLQLSGTVPAGATRAKVYAILRGSAAGGAGSFIVDDMKFLAEEETPVDTQAPSAPASLAATGKTDTTASLSWTASTDNVGVAGYEIFRNGAKIGTAAAANFTDTGLTAETSYKYTVKAYDAAGNLSAASNEVTVVTSAGPDTQAPSVPAGLASNGKTETSVSLIWTASTDNKGIAGYEIWRDNAKIGTSTATSFTDSGLTASTAYNYKVSAFDVAGNLSALSAGITVTTNDAPSTGKVTIYYKKGYANPYIHYRPIGGAWTTAPGVAIQPSEISGYNKITVDVGTATGLEAVFNNGSGTWDNNGGKNYIFPLGVSNFGGGTIQPGVPVPSAENTVTIYYKQGYAAPYIHWRPEGGTWTSAPGQLMQSSEIAGYSKVTLSIGTATRAEVCFNNGSGTWDSNGGKNYFFNAGTSTFNSGNIVNGSPQ